MQGWIKLHRQLQENTLWTCEPFTRGQAWVDLILLANHKDDFFYLRDHKIEVKRGQVGWSVLKLSDRWRWSRSKVNKFIKDLEKEQQVEQQASKSTSVLTIINYDKYQEKEQHDEQQKDNRKTTERQQKDINKNDNNNKERKEDKKYNIRTDLLSLNVEKEIIDSWLLIRKNKKAVNTKIAFNAVKREIEKTTLSANECLNIAVEKSWAGFKAEWIKNETNESHEINRRRNEQKPTRAEEAVNGIAARLEEAHRLETQG